MNNTFIPLNFFNAALLVLLSMILVACTEHAPGKQQDHGDKSLDLNAVEGGRGKPGAPVRLSFEVPGDITAGSTVEVNLAFDSSTAAGSLAVDLNSDNGLTLLSNARHSFDLAGEAMTMTVQLQAERDGLHYLHVNVRESGPGAQPLLGRSFAVPVQVGRAQPAMQTTGKVLEQGEEKIIEMISR